MGNSTSSSSNSAKNSSISHHYQEKRSEDYRSLHTNATEANPSGGVNAHVGHNVSVTQDPATQRLVAALGALRVGKLPDQDQISKLLRYCLRSPFLREEGEPLGGGGTGAGQTALSQSGRKLRNDVRNLVDAALRLGMEKNSDDILQEFIYQCARTGPRADIDIDVDVEERDARRVQAAIPNDEEISADATEFEQSLRSVAPLLLTSIAFRFIIAEVIGTLRGSIIKTAETVEIVAGKVAKTATDVEEIVARPDVDIEDFRSVAQNVKNIRADIGEDRRVVESDQGPPEGRNERNPTAFVRRVQLIMSKIHQDDATQEAFSRIFRIVQKYGRRLRAIREATPGVHPISVNLYASSQTLPLLRTILERLANNRSLDSFLAAVNSLLTDIVNSPMSAPKSSTDPATGETITDESQGNPHPLLDYINLWNKYLERSLAGTNGETWSKTPQATNLLTEIYHLGYDLWEQTSELDVRSATKENEAAVKWKKDLTSAVEEYGSFVDGMKIDRGTMGFVNAAEDVWADLSESADIMSKKGEERELAKQKLRKRQTDMKNDLLGWLLPRIFDLLNTLELPLPRFEYQDAETDLIIGGAILGPMLAGADARLGEKSSHWRDIEKDRGTLQRSNELATAIQPYLIPDRFVIQNWNEMVVEFGVLNPNGSTGSRTLSRSHLSIHVIGLRLSVHHLLYDLRYRPRSPMNRFLLLCMGGRYKDAGEATLQIGHDNDPGTGMNITIEMDINNFEDRIRGMDEDGANVTHPRFKVTNVHVALPPRSLNLRLEKTRHTILNDLFVEPLVRGKLGRKVTSRLAEKYIRAGVAVAVDSAERVGRGVGEANSKSKGRREGEKKMAFGDWVKVIQNALDTGETQAEMRATNKGFIRTSRPAGTEPGHLGQSTMAIGVGGQIFPDTQLGGEDARRAGVGEGIAGDIQGHSEKVEESTRGVVEDARQLVSSIGRAGEVQRGKEGWRSDAFNF